MLFWAETVNVTVSNGTGVKRDVRGGVKKKPACHRRPAIGGDPRPSVDFGNGEKFGAIISCPPGGSHGPGGPPGGAGRSASKKRQDRRPSAKPALGTVDSFGILRTTTSLPRNPPLITFPHQMRANRKIRVGSDCSGWASEVHALRLLGLGSAIDHRFACDIVEASKTIIFKNCRPKIWYDDCLARDNRHSSTPTVDIYVAGFPCQPYSAAGKNKGMTDSRADVFSGVLDYIRHRLPTIFVLENVKNLTSKTHKATFDHITDQLMSITDKAGKYAYSVDWKVFNSQDFGVPQHRERLYIIGIRRSAFTLGTRQSTLIELVDSSRKPAPPLAQFLGLLRLPRKTIEACISQDIQRFSQTAKRNLRNAMAEVKASNIDPSRADIVVDLGNGRRDVVNMVHNHCPTITRTRGGREDFYLISAAGRLTMTDFFKLQGLDPQKIDMDGIRYSALGHLAGNAMTIPVLAAVLRAALLYTGLAYDI
jgi:DNA-cytosine methyltransferase